MKSLFLTLVIALSTSSAFGKTLCSDASSQIQYVSTSYERGIPPRLGDETNRTQILVKGKLVSESVVYHQKEAVLGPINPDFTEIKVLRQQTDAGGSSRDFSALLTLSKNPQYRGTQPEVALPISAFVICRQVTKFVP